MNADGYVSTGTGLLGYNMYAYCNNNRVMGYGSNGNMIIHNPRMFFNYGFIHEAFYMVKGVCMQLISYIRKM
ncbi:MAG: hypothetical protein L6V84_08485 [Oscillospiraceae bacterium]|nr:MAG: hypothetical protein L6V84_08485 [Oscillospiraceae bacterium]